MKPLVLDNLVVPLLGELNKRDEDASTLSSGEPGWRRTPNI